MLNQPRQKGVMETLLRSEQIQVERKLFFFDLKENQRGRFLKITEDVNGRRDTIIIPAPGLEDFARIVDEMRMDAEDRQPMFRED